MLFSFGRVREWNHGKGVYRAQWFFKSLTGAAGEGGGESVRSADGAESAAVSESVGTAMKRRRTATENSLRRERKHRPSVRQRKQAVL